jgi:hypothetical protein
MFDLFLGKAYFVVEKPRERRVMPEPLRRSAQYGTAISRVSLASSEASFCVRICLSLEELILGAASVTQTVPGRIADSAGSMVSTKTVIRDIRIFFHFFIAIPPSKKYDGSLY